MAEAYSLAILELLIQQDGCRRIDELWSILAAKFQRCNDFFSVVGTTPDALESFIRKQPALFSVSGGYAYTPDAYYNIFGNDPIQVSSGHHGFRRAGSEHITNHGGSSYCFEKLPNTLEIEMEAVKYFQDQLLRKTERWIPIKSLAGHLSQASPSIRMVVGPQSEFALFLLRYPMIFQLQGELVGLSDKIRTQWSGSQFISGKRKPRPLSFHGTEDPRKAPAERSQLPMHLQTSPAVPEDPLTRNCNAQKSTIALSIEDCKALLWLKYTVAQSQKQPMPFASLLSAISCAPKSVPSSIGWTQIELLEFLRKYNKIFDLDDVSHDITQQPTNSLHLMIVNKTTSSEDSNVLLAKRGCIFCVNRLWGIIDLGFHEHVFFDRSLFKHVTDLSKHFQVKETVFFNAVLASKESRAKWRATCVWKETDRLANYLQGLAPTRGGPFVTDEFLDMSLDDPDSGLENSDHVQPIKKSPLDSLRPLFDDVSDAFDQCAPQFASVRLAEAWELQLSPTGCALIASSELPIEPNTNGDVFDCCEKSAVKGEHLEIARSRSISPVSELNTLSGVPSISGMGDASSSARSSSPPRSNDRARCCMRCTCGAEIWTQKPPVSILRTVATQTLFTGEIMATKLYHEGAVS